MFGDYKSNVSFVFEKTCSASKAHAGGACLFKGQGQAYLTQAQTGMSASPCCLITEEGVGEDAGGEGVAGVDVCVDNVLAALELLEALQPLAEQFDLDAVFLFVHGDNVQVTWTVADAGTEGF